MQDKFVFSNLDFSFILRSPSKEYSLEFLREKTLWDINFIRKEKVYTKLKYSRTQSYDIVSAGVAALFAGLLGFLICEKFGFEMVDGGDFFFCFLYIAGLCFSIKPLFSIYTGSLKSFVKLIIRSFLVWVKWLSFMIIIFYDTNYDFDEEEF